MSLTAQELINKFKKEMQHKFVVNEDIERMPTGIDVIDIATGGGLPAGGFVLVTGTSGVGKTLLALNIISSTLKRYPDAVCMVIDSETSLTMERLNQLNVDTTRTIVIRHATVEDVFDSIASKFFEIKENLCPNTPSIILWDSIASTPTEKETNAIRIEEALGLKARILSAKLPVFCQKLEKYKTCMIAINQLRESIVINPYDRKEDMVKGLDGSMPGGVVQYYQASILLKLKSSGVINTSGVEIHKSTLAQTKDLDMESSFYGYKLDLVFLKNKFAIKRPLSVVIDTVKGINHFYTKVQYLVDYKYLNTAGGWYQLAGHNKKFRMKEIENLYNTDEEFRTIFEMKYKDIIENIKYQLYKDNSLDVNQDNIISNTSLDTTEKEVKEENTGTTLENESINEVKNNTENDMGNE